MTHQTQQSCLPRRKFIGSASTTLVGGLVWVSTQAASADSADGPQSVQTEKFAGAPIYAFPAPTDAWLFLPKID